MTLMEFSLIPLDKGESLSRYIGGTLDIVHESGLDYRLNPMGTVVEGDWDELLRLLTRCFRALEKESNRIIVHANFDFRKGVTGTIERKIKSVEEKAGHEFRI
jgi:uncharacterized protein (TIGR00106 family)